MRRCHWHLWAAGAACSLVVLATVLVASGRGSHKPGIDVPQESRSLGDVWPSVIDSEGRPPTAQECGLRLVEADGYRVALVRLRVTSVTPRTAVVSVEVRRSDGKPIPRDVTFDTTLTDNRGVQYNVGSSYQEFGPDGEEVSAAQGARPHSILQTVITGPLHERVRWFAVEVSIYRQEAVPGRLREFHLTPLQVLDFGRHGIPSAPSAEPVHLVSLAGRQVPVYPGARDVEVYNRAHWHWGSVSYVVADLPYPSLDVAAFYNEWALDHAWVVYGDAEPSWGSFLDSTRGGHTWVHRLWLEWTEKNSSDHLVLVCEYVLPEDSEAMYRRHSNSDQIVHLGIYPAQSVGPGEQIRAR